MAALAATTAALALCATAGANHSVTDRISTGVINGNGAVDAGFSGAIPDGTRVFFRTAEPLVSTDTDANVDVYERSGATTTLISAGAINGNGDHDATLVGHSADGTRVFFSTTESLVAADTDSSCTDEGDPTERSCRDVYQRLGGATTLLTGGANGSFDADYVGSSADGTRVFFETTEKLLAADTDNFRDIYERVGTTTTLVVPTNGAFDTDFVGTSTDGTKVFIETAEPLVGSDTDSGCTDDVDLRPCRDVYLRSGGTTTQLSIGTINGNGTFDASLAATSPDGTRVLFQTQEALVAGDTDTVFDVYQRLGSTTTLISEGAINGDGPEDAGLSGASVDATKVFFRSFEQLVSADTDASLDIYQRSGGTTTLVSAGAINGNGAFDVFYRGASDDGTHVFFTSAEPLAAGDTDTQQDIYDRAAGTTTLISAGAINGNGAYMVAFRGNSADGSRVFFTTRERLVSADSDPVGTTCVGTTCSFDVYEVFGGTTSLISFGPDNGTRNATWGGSSDDGTRVWYTTAKPQLAADTDAVQDVYQAGVTQGGYPRPKGASPLRSSLVLAYTQCTTANRTHGPPMVFPSCNPPAKASAHLTIGSPDANGAASNSSGFRTFKAFTGNPSTPADEADVIIDLSITDVRNAVGLTDYTGQLLSTQTLRVTDRLSGSVAQDPATVQDFPFNLTVPCTATGATTIGSTCALQTTADALMPGMVVEQKRTMWEVSQAQVFDGGADGVASTTPNTLFAVQGIFVP